MNVEFYSLSNSLYFVILCYIEWKIYMFLWRPAISGFLMPKSLAIRRKLAFKIQYLKG